MLSIFLVFAYISLLSLLFGFSLTNFFYRPLDTHPSLTILSVLGLALLTALGAVISLVMPLGLWANLILVSIALILLLAAGKPFFALLAAKLRAIRSFHPLTLLLFGAIFIIVLVKSAQPPVSYDTGLYHAQNIRWIETYPLVPGLGNLHDRLAFNSNWLLVSALFSYSFLGFSGFHSLGALLVLLVTAFSLHKFDRLLKGENTLSNAAAIFVVFLLRRIFSLELPAPGTDLPAALLVWLIFLIGMEKIEDGTAARLDQKTLSLLLLSTFALTIKVSVLPILIIPAYFVIRAVRTLKLAALLTGAGAAALILIPWLARNVVISGYLVYPLPATAWFHLDWAIPTSQAQETADTITAWARVAGSKPDEVLNLPLTAWVPLWVQNLEALDRQILLGLGAGTVILLLFVLAAFFRSKKLPETLPRYAIFYFTALVGIGFWFFQAPHFRFGYGFLGIYLSLLAAPIFTWLASTSKRLRMGLGMLALAALLLYQFVGFYNLRQIPELRSFWILPGAYPEVAVLPASLGRFTLYLPVEGDQCWYTPFPCIPALSSDVIPRGEHLEDGFRSGSNALIVGKRRTPFSNNQYHFIQPRDTIKFTAVNNRKEGCDGVF